MDIKIGVVSLGCDKNRVDTENMLAYLSEAGYTITPSAEDADIIIVNTCAFIESDKEEAINTIFEMSEYKNAKCRYLIVTGCLPQRYMDELSEAMPEVDAFLGTGSYDKIVDVVNKLYNESGMKIALKNDKDERNFTSKRYLTTPYHYAYLKIAEGCSNHCTYCAIPSIRGKFTSREKSVLIDEAKSLVYDYGVKELNIVAQDVTKYGKDIYGRYALIELIEELSKIDVSWIRLLYCYPELVSDELIKTVSQNDKVVKYLDIPLQHTSDKILKLMNRRVDGSEIRKLITKIREEDKDISIRSTFIVGFPNESEEDFADLKSFVNEYELDKCGFFAYSKEEGTAAARMKGHILTRVKNKRLKELYAIQNEVMRKKALDKVGKTMKVLYEGIDYDNGLFIARSEFDAPDIDTNIYMRSEIPLNIGDFYNVKIVDTDNIDLIGEVIE